MQIKLTVMRLLFNGIIYYLIFKSYYLFINLMNSVIDLHFWFLNICWGIIGVTYAKAIIDRAKPLIDVPLKMIDLASIAIGSNSIAECTSLVFSKFKSVTIIVTVNKLMRTILNKVYESLEFDFLQKFYDKLKNSSVKSVVKFAENVLGIVTDNIDECILCSCFVFEESLYDSLVFSVKNLWRSLKDISLSVVSMLIFTKIMNGLMFFGYAYFVAGIWRWDVNFIVQVFLYYYIIKNIINDVLYTPLVYRTVCNRFVDSIDSLTEDPSSEAESILNNIPELEKIKKIMENN